MTRKDELLDIIVGIGIGSLIGLLFAVAAWKAVG